MIKSLLMTTQIVDRDDPVLGFTHDWIASLAQHVQELHILTPRKGRTHLPSHVTVHHLTQPNQPVGRIANHAFHHNTFRQLILKRRVDGVFVHMIPKWAVAAAPYCKLVQTPLMLWYAHGHVSKVLKVAEKMVDSIVSSTPEGCRLNSAKLQIVGQGIDTTHFKPAAREGLNGRFRIITVGRLSPVKNLERTLETIRHLVNQHQAKQVLLDLIGGPSRPEDSAYVQTLKKQVAHFGIETHVKFIGTRNYDTIVAEYQQADLLLNLSQTNSLDKVALEAMACGIPVLTSNPAFRALMQDVASSLYLHSADPEQTAVAIKAIMQQPQAQRRETGLKLRQQVVKEHNLDQLAQRFIHTLEHSK